MKYDLLHNKCFTYSVRIRILNPITYFVRSRSVLDMSMTKILVKAVSF